MCREPAVSGITSGFESAPPKWLGNSRHGTSTMLRMKAPLLSEAMVAPSQITRSNDQRPAVDIDSRPGRKSVRHETEDLPGDILADTNAADRQRGRGLRQHVAPRFLRH